MSSSVPPRSEIRVESRAPEPVESTVKAAPRRDLRAARAGLSPRPQRSIAWATSPNERPASVSS